jgi:hypothetical protein
MYAYEVYTYEVYTRDFDLSLTAPMSCRTGRHTTVLGGMRWCVMVPEWFRTLPDGRLNTTEAWAIEALIGSSESFPPFLQASRGHCVRRHYWRSTCILRQLIAAKIKTARINACDRYSAWLSWKKF